MKDRSRALGVKVGCGSPWITSAGYAKPRGSRLSDMANKKILLIEPGYRNKYPPLGLMKIAQYHGPRGKGDWVRFIKGEDRSVLAEAWDRVYITTLFSFEYRKTAASDRFRARGGQRPSQQDLRRWHRRIPNERAVLLRTALARDPVH